MEHILEQSYIGDGVYVDIYRDGGCRLWTHRATGTHEIFFEPGMLDQLVHLHNKHFPKTTEIK